MVTSPTISGRIVPVVIIERTEHILPLAHALREGGINVIEITLRTEAAWAAAEIVRQKLPDMQLGLGTLLCKEDVTRAAALSVDFVVSPGLTDDLAQACQEHQLPLLPGVATASEIMRARAWGYRIVKFFPAAQAGGIPLLKAWRSPFADMRFCPTGGIDARNAGEYLALPHVPYVGGAWVAPAERILAADWDGIRALAQEACALAAQTSEAK